MKFGCVIPAYSVSQHEMRDLLESTSHTFSSAVIVENDTRRLDRIDHPSPIEVRVIRYPGPIGKSRALTLGLQELLKDQDISVVSQLDGHGKQPPRDVRKLIAAVNSATADVAIADRYSSQEMEGQRHRVTALTWTRVVEVIAGVRVTDAVCGMRAYSRAAAEIFASQMQSYGYGCEIEQIILCGRNGLKVCEIGVGSNRQADSTAAEKIEDNLQVLLSYAGGGALNSGQINTLCRIMSGVKSRDSFTLDCIEFGMPGMIRFEFIGKAEDDEDSYALTRQK
ncbi:glycosyltransferase [Streptomyces collinus]|uniref:glycosyltransferase n=1 Tax=Streptomyces collinus TaxID=42684 RepID=UPI00367893EC